MLNTNPVYSPFWGTYAALSCDMPLCLCLCVFVCVCDHGYVPCQLSVLALFFKISSLSIFSPGGELYASRALNQKHDCQGGAGSRWSEGEDCPMLFVVENSLQRICPNSHN